MVMVDRRSLEASIYRDSFPEFVKAFWDVVIPEGLVWNWHMDVLCEELQTLAERVFLGKPRKYDLIINVPPGSSKSSICSIMFPAWIWARHPEMRTICASYAHTLALNLSRLSRLVIRDDLYQTLFPGVSLCTDQDTKGHFANTAGGMRYCVGIGGSVTGYHGHFLIVDDPLDPNAAVSEKELETANKWMTETLPTRKVDKAVVPMVLIMQRLHQNDPTGMFLEKEREARRAGDSKGEHIGIRHICLPAEVSDLVRPRSLRRRYEDGLLDPVRLSRQVLDTYKPPNLTEFAYSGQFCQSPVPQSGGMFKVERLNIDDPPPYRKFASIVRYWDKAGTGGGGAFTVGVLMGLDNLGRFWVLDVVRGQWDSHEREQLIRQQTKFDAEDLRRGGFKGQYRIGVEQEPGSGGKESAESTIRNLRGYVVKADRPTGDKASRAGPYSTQVNGGNVYLRKADWNRSYREELKYFSSENTSTYKDQVDASSGAFNMQAKPAARAGGLRRSRASKVAQ